MDYDIIYLIAGLIAIGATFIFNELRKRNRGGLFVDFIYNIADTDSNKKIDIYEVLNIGITTGVIKPNHLNKID